ncbi:hypothetical protein M8J75_001671 [Diaphorina citri]|nr:hypothetical protein M8J75_001671 [Diaphorina citri]
MFNFIKKNSSSGLATGVEKEEKERRKREKKERKEREKKERALLGEDILRIDDVRRSLKLRGRRKEKEKLPSGITADYSANFFTDIDREKLQDEIRDSTCLGVGKSDTLASDSSENSLSSMSTATGPSTAAASSSKGKVLPPLPPRPPKRGILKGPRVNILNEDCTDDTNVLLANTLQNELIAYSNLPLNSKHVTRTFLEAENGSGELGYPRSRPMSNRQASSMESLTTEDSSSFLTPPFSSSPVGEGQGFHSRFLLTAGAGGLASSSEDLIDLPLPDIIPVKLPVPRDLTIPRQSPRNDFGFSLRRAMVVERAGGGYALRPVIFAEPGPSAQHQNDTGLLPGDRLLQVNGVDVEEKTREEIIELIKSSESAVTVRVQPVAELCELSRRSGLDGVAVELDDNYIRSGTLRRSGSLRFKNSRDLNYKTPNHRFSVACLFNSMRFVCVCL